MTMHILPSASGSRSRTKVVATIGPATAAPERIDALLRAGMDVARLNFSHGDHDMHAELIRRLRSAAAAAGRPLAILQDLQGPRLRLMDVCEGVSLEHGQVLCLDDDPTPGESRRVGVAYAAELAAQVEPGDRVLIDDGRIELQVESVSYTHLTLPTKACSAWMP
jgi:pyruvate kinase